MDNPFDYFVLHDLSPSNLNNITNLYILIGTYPMLLHNTPLTSKYAPIVQSLLNNLVLKKLEVLINKALIQIHSYTLNNSVFFFIDQYFDQPYFELLQEYLNLTFHTTTFKVYIENSRMCIIFSEIKCSIYLLSITIPTMHEFRYPSLPNIDKNVPEQMTYSLKCNLLSETWGLFFHNISLFLTANLLNTMYILNDAIMFPRHIIPNIIDNKNFEFFCEIGYILNQLYLQNLGDKIYVYMPTDRNEPYKFTDIPRFQLLNDQYEFNYGSPKINADGTLSNSEEQLALAEKGLDGRIVDFEYIPYDGHDDHDHTNDEVIYPQKKINYTLIEYVRKKYPKIREERIELLRNK
jgi:hypothetical protein